MTLQKFFRTAVLAVTCIAALSACGAPELPPATVGVEQMQVTDLVVGNGAEAVAGKSVTAVHYSGWLYDPRSPSRRASHSTARAMRAGRSRSRSVPGR